MGMIGALDSSHPVLFASPVFPQFSRVFPEDFKPPQRMGWRFTIAVSEITPLFALVVAPIAGTSILLAFNGGNDILVNQLNTFTMDVDPGLAYNLVLGRTAAVSYYVDVMMKGSLA